MVPMIFVVIAFLTDSDTDRLKQLGLGGALAVTIIGMVLWFLLKKRETNVNASTKPDTSGDRTVEFWQVTISKIVKDCIEDQIEPLLGEIRGDQSKVNEVLRDRLHAILNTLQRIETIVTIGARKL